MKKSILESMAILKNNAYYGRKFRTLKGDSLKTFEIFIEDNYSDDKNDFELKVNRMFLDMPDKPKNWTLICELLSAFNGLRFTKGDK